MISNRVYGEEDVVLDWSQYKVMSSKSAMTSR